MLQSDELTQSRIYRLEYQKALKKQVEAILEKLHSDQFTTIQQFLSESYTDAFVGTAYDMFGQGVPLIMPVDRNAAVKAVVTDSKLSASLYDSLGVDIKKMKTTIQNEITRGIASGLPHSQIARNLASAATVSFGRAKTIVRTEAHRIQEASRHDAQKTAVDKGAKVVKMWDSTLDRKTRRTHRKLDGQVREVDEPFEIEGRKAMYPGDFGDPAEDCNCRCIATQRARIALNENELKTLEDRAKYWGLDKTEDFDDFKRKYLKADEQPFKITIDSVYDADPRYGSEAEYLEWRKANMPILKENGIRSNAVAKEEWVKKRMQYQQNSLHVVSKEDAIRTISGSIPDQSMRSWFVSADSDAKPKILEAIMRKDDVWNAGLNISWRNYVETTGKDISFETFLTKPIKMYRGTRGQMEVESDVWVSFSFDRKIAESFGTEIEEITIRPIDTWGSFQTTAEGELLVPRMWLMKHRKK